MTGWLLRADEPIVFEAAPRGYELQSRVAREPRRVVTPGGLWDGRDFVLESLGVKTQRQPVEVGTQIHANAATNP